METKIQTPFIIDQVSWHTHTMGNPESRGHITGRFYSIARFLQDRGLTVRSIVGDMAAICDDFAISSSDLTDEGLLLMKESYDEWLRNIDHGMDIRDVSLFEMTLKRIRSN